MCVYVCVCVCVCAYVCVCTGVDKTKTLKNERKLFLFWRSVSLTKLRFFGVMQI